MIIWERCPPLFFSSSKGPERPRKKIKIWKTFLFHTLISPRMSWHPFSITAEKTGGRQENLPQVKSVIFWSIQSIKTVFGKNQQQINKLSGVFRLPILHVPFLLTFYEWLWNWVESCVMLCSVGIFIWCFDVFIT